MSHALFHYMKYYQISQDLICSLLVQIWFLYLQSEEVQMLISNRWQGFLFSGFGVVWWPPTIMGHCRIAAFTFLFEFSVSVWISVDPDQLFHIIVAKREKIYYCLYIMFTHSLRTWDQAGVMSDIKHILYIKDIVMTRWRLFFGSFW